MSSDLRPSDADAIKEGIPPGAALSAAREAILPARTWTEIGFDGLEIYLDAEQAARFLVRKVTLRHTDKEPRRRQRNEQQDRLALVQSQHPPSGPRTME